MLQLSPSASQLEANLAEREQQVLEKEVLVEQVTRLSRPLSEQLDLRQGDGLSLAKKVDGRIVYSVRNAETLQTCPRTPTAERVAGADHRHQPPPDSSLGAAPRQAGSRLSTAAGDQREAAAGEISVIRSWLAPNMQHILRVLLENIQFYFRFSHLCFFFMHPFSILLPADLSLLEPLQRCEGSGLD